MPIRNQGSPEACLVLDNTSPTHASNTQNAVNLTYSLDELTIAARASALIAHTRELSLACTVKDESPCCPGGVGGGLEKMAVYGSEPIIIESMKAENMIPNGRVAVQPLAMWEPKLHRSLETGLGESQNEQERIYRELGLLGIPEGFGSPDLTMFKAWPNLRNWKITPIIAVEAPPRFSCHVTRSKREARAKDH
jgi:hypothetical protein